MNKRIMSFGKYCNEILIGYYSRAFFNDSIAWGTKRLGPRKLRRDKFPVFVERQEVIDAGWKIV